MSVLEPRLPQRVGDLVEGPWETPSATARRRGPALFELLGLVLVAALVPLTDAWIAQAVSLLLLLTLPGAVVLRAARVPGATIAGFPVLVPAASIVLLTLVGLAVDLIGLGLGFDAPLQTAALLITIEAVSLLLLVAGVFAPAEAGVAWRLPDVAFGAVWPVVLPLLAAAGAFRLTNQSGNGVAMAALVATIVALGYAIVRADQLGTTTLRLVVYSAALALLWSFSLRGDFVFGYDISSEFHFLDSTFRSHVWHSGHRDDAYGAMLSLTVFPAVLHALAGASPLLLLKAVYPAVFATFAVGVFDLARRYVAPRFAVIAVAIIVSQTYFFEGMAAIARQEIGLLMFIALLGVALEGPLPRGRRIGLIALFAAGLVVSHYSTAYLAIAMFAVATVLGGLAVLVRRRPGELLGIGAAFLATAAFAAVWYGAITHSTQNVSSFSDSLRDNGLQLLPNRGPNQSVLDAYINGNAVSKVSPAEYQKLIDRQYEERRDWVKPLRAADDPRYALQPASLTAKPENLAGHGARSAGVLATQAVNLLAVLASLVLLLGPGIAPRLRTIGLLGVSTLGALAFLRLSGTAANAYNQERAFVQATVVLAIAVGLALQWLSGRHRRLDLAVAVLAVGALLVMLGGSSGLRANLLGGGSTANLANAGEDYERFYAQPADLGAARWMQAIVPRTDLRYADGYAQLRLLAQDNRTDGLLNAVTPRTLDRHAWVFGSSVNVVSGRTRGSLDRRFSVYAWPKRYLDDYFDLVYDNGGAAVFHR
jgi:hypothetical protein